VRQSVEDTINSLLDAEADAIGNATRYQHTPDRLDSRAGSYKRKLLTTSGEVELTVPRLRRLPFETQIIQRYKTKQSSVEEALIKPCRCFSSESGRHNRSTLGIQGQFKYSQ
jgi:transposase-like protein